MGTNHVAGNRVLQDLPPSKRPEILTFEMNANVALAQRIGLGFGSSVRYTGGDPLMKYKSSALKRLGPSTIEDVIMFPNRLLSGDDKNRVVWLNLDYCGGPPKNHSVEACSSFMTACLAHLFYLYMVTVTIARRNHADLEKTFDAIFPPPYGFRLHKVYMDNRRVVCKMYVRDTSVVRHVVIPGNWWKNASSTSKHSFFDGVIVSKQGKMHKVYVPEDDDVFSIHETAVAAYAAD